MKYLLTYGYDGRVQSVICVFATREGAEEIRDALNAALSEGSSVYSYGIQEITYIEN